MILNELLKLMPDTSNVVIDTSYIIYEGNLFNIPDIIKNRNYIVCGILPEFRNLYIKVKEI